MRIQVNLKKHLYSYFEQYKGILKFLSRFGVLFLLLFVMFQRFVAGTPAMDSILSVYAGLNRLILDFLGFRVRVSGNIVFQSDGFAILISSECLAITHTMALVSAICVYKAAVRYKIAAVSIGILIIQIINIIRIISVYSVGIYQMEWFDFVHDIFWKPVMVILIITLLLFFLKKSNRVVSADQ